MALALFWNSKRSKRSKQLGRRICTEDKKKLIDTHYGAIAAKAVMLKPKDLTVQEKAQEEFEKMLPGWT